MKKYSKIITLVIALVMVVSIFSGFTFKTVQSNDLDVHNHRIEVDNLALVACGFCRGDGYCNIGICSGEAVCTHPSCGACDGSGVCPECNGTGKVEGSASTPTPTPTPDPAICRLSSIMYINDEAYTIDIENFVGETVKLELLATSSKGHTLTYSWKKDDVAINNATAIYTEVCNTVGARTLVCTASCSTCGVSSSDSTKVTTVVKPIPSPTPTASPIVPTKTSDVEFYLIDNLNYSNNAKLFFKMKVPTDMVLGEYKKQYLNTNGLVKGFYSYDLFGYHKMDDYHKVTDVGTKKNYILVDNVALILDIETPSVGKPSTIVKIQSIKVDYLVDSKIYTTINVLQNEVVNTMYNIEPQYNLFKTFKGWGLTAEATEVIEFGWKPTTNTTLYAIYETNNTVPNKPSNTLTVVLIIVVFLIVLSILYWILRKFKK